MASNFNNDLISEKIVHEFLVDNIYNNSFLYDNVEVTTSMVDQFKGIDVKLTSPAYGGVYLIDEKTQVTKLDGGYPTFAFELWSNGGIGWFINPKKVTTHYLLAWLRTKDQKTLRKTDDITSLEYVLISRKNVVKILKKNGFNFNKVDEILDELIDSNDRKPQKFINKNWWVTKTLNYYEKPINVVIRKSELIKNSLIHNIIN